MSGDPIAAAERPAREQVLVAYIPVLHDGYRRFLERHGRGRELHLIGPELYADYRPLAKDIRALDPALMRDAIDALAICSSVDVLRAADAAALAARSVAIVMPSEDVSVQVAERYFERCEVSYDSVFLRWDRTRAATLQAVAPSAQVRIEAALAALIGAAAPAGAAATPSPLGELAHAAAAQSIDWFRQVGAALRTVSGELLWASNEHTPFALSAYAVGDPRASFYRGVHLELCTAEHAEAHLVGEAARRGLALAGATVYVTDFPCPPCARLLARAAVARLYYERGYAVLDGADVLAAAGVEVVQVLGDGDRKA